MTRDPGVSLRRFAAGALFATIAAAAPAQPVTGARGLVLTISSYPGLRLPGVSRDEAHARAILARLDVPSDRIRAVRDAALSAEGLRAALEQLADETRPGERVVVYFSGLGSAVREDGACQAAWVAADGRTVSARDLAGVWTRLRAHASTLDILSDAGHAASAAPPGGSGLQAKVSAAADCSTTAGIDSAATGTRSTVNLDRDDLSLAAARPGEAAYDTAAGGQATLALRACLEQSADAAPGTVAEWVACAQRRLEGLPAVQHLSLAGPAERRLPPMVTVSTAGPAAASGSGAAGRRVALVIGNGAYRQGPLANPTHDARDIADSLRRSGFEVIERENAAVRDYGALLTRFRERLAGASVGLFFYAGHGMQVRGENYLPGVDQSIRSEEDVPAQSLPVRQVVEIIESSRVPLGLLFLDACRDSPFARATRSGGGGLSRVEAAAGMLISFATRPGQVASDGDGQRNGLYTGQLLAAIEAAGDQPVELMLKRVAAGVRSASRGQQDPWIEGSLTGDFCFRGCRGAAAPAAMAQAPMPAPAPAPAPAPSATDVKGTKAEAPAVASVTRPAPPAAVAAPASSGAANAADARSRPLALSHPLPAELLFVHGDTPTATGRIFRVQAGRVDERFVRPAEGNRGIQSAVAMPGGDLFFCDGTETRIFRLRNGKVDLHFRHDGFVRHLALDDHGRLHFSANQGPRSDGAIYRIENGQAILVAPVPVAAVGGSWSGAFAFDPRGTLWLSTGEATPAALYRLDKGQPQRIFETREHAIMGFAFQADGTLLFADNAHSVYELRLPGPPRKLFDSPFDGRLRSVVLIDRRPA